MGATSKCILSNLIQIALAIVPTMMKHFFPATLPSP